MTLAGATVAVTGATGFLGRYVVDVLQKRGARVVGVVRNPDRVPELRARGVELRRADLADPAALALGFRGADAVVANAALVSLRIRDVEAYHSTNVRGTTNVFEAVAAVGVRRVVQVSSVAVYQGSSRRAFDEDHPQHGERRPGGLLGAYAFSKARSEQRAWELAATHDLALTALRPCGIYGAFDGKFMAAFKLLTRPPVTVFPAYLRLSLVYAGDVAEAVALALEEPVAVGRAYNVTGEDRSLWEFLRAWRAAGGRAAAVPIPLPVPVRRLYDHGRARRELGWRNRPLVEALRETLALERAAAAPR